MLAVGAFSWLMGGMTARMDLQSTCTREKNTCEYERIKSQNALSSCEARLSSARQASPALSASDYSNIGFDSAFKRKQTEDRKKQFLDDLEEQLKLTEKENAQLKAKLTRVAKENNSCQARFGEYRQSAADGLKSKIKASTFNDQHHNPAVVDDEDIASAIAGQEAMLELMKEVQHGTYVVSR